MKVNAGQIVSAAAAGLFLCTSLVHAQQTTGTGAKTRIPISDKETSWAFVEGGTFQTGGVTEDSAGQPVRSVTVSSFHMEKHEVTYELWTSVRTWALEHGYSDLTAGLNGYNPVGTQNPVTEVSWFDAVKWCNARSERDGLAPVYYTSSAQDTVYREGDLGINVDAVKWTAAGYRLPTEVEWRFAAIGGRRTHGYAYSGSNDIHEVGWYYTNSDNTTHPVGGLAPNELGIFDMSGSVWELCWDWYDSALPSGGATDPKGPSTAQTYRVMLGGAFMFGAGNTCRVADPGFTDPFDRAFYAGFRCARN